jgi:hypothetical protein
MPQTNPKGRKCAKKYVPGSLLMAQSDKKEIYQARNTLLKIED